jgi:hypothetical protein
MATHVKVLGILYILFSALSLFAALFLMLAVSAASGIVATTADPHDAAIALPIIGISGTALVAFLLLVAAPGLIVGVGLLKYRPWARILGIALSALNLIHIPFGTMLGIYGLWVLLNKETEGMFNTGVVPSA